MSQSQGAPAQPPATTQLSRVRYRVGQFFHGFFAAELGEDERQLVADLLPVDAAALFFEMPMDAQRHSINVLHVLGEAGYEDADLGAAALLHDVGKAEAKRAGVGINLWWRGPLVLSEAVAPERLQRQARTDHSAGWRYALHVHFAHPQIGADWAREAGCSELTCWLIEHHQDESAPDEETIDHRYQLLAALQWADGLN